ncbi:uncharacterized protein LOC106475628 isoform X2 [Limulus polyphemus]|uniref:Uncharacterized protein LOC106475628 isoform X2 n=1 Tax=Limulus polyphemus TaxID=6850 RepID=A0ABM1RVJ4_LIMPO|nr:uncharacterized protein LOC106475628 isoform X2 [Limulus polyphemus]
MIISFMSMPVPSIKCVVSILHFSSTGRFNVFSNATILALIKLHCKHFKTTNMEKKLPMHAIICNPLSSNANIKPAFLPCTSSDSSVNLTKEQFNLELSKNCLSSMETLASSKVVETKLTNDVVSSTSSNVFGLHVQSQEPADLPVFSETDTNFENQKASKRTFHESKVQPCMNTTVLNRSTVVDDLRGMSYVTEGQSNSLNFSCSTTTYQKKGNQKVQSQCTECFPHTDSHIVDNTSPQEKTVQQIGSFRMETQPVHISAVISKEERSLQSPPPKLFILSSDKDQLVPEKEADEVKNSIQSFSDDKPAYLSKECVEKSLTVEKLLLEPTILTDPLLEGNECWKWVENITCEELNSFVKEDHEVKRKLEKCVPTRQTETGFESKKLLTSVETDSVRPKHCDDHCVETTRVNSKISGFHKMSVVGCENIKHQHTLKVLSIENSENTTPECETSGHQGKLVVHESDEYDKLTTFSGVKPPEILMLEKQMSVEAIISSVTENQEKLYPDKKLCCEMTTSSVTGHQEKVVLDKNKIDEMSTSSVTEHQENLVLDKNKIDEMSTSSVTEHQENLVLDKNKIDEMSTSSVTEHQENLVLDKNKIDEMSTSSVTEHQDDMIHKHTIGSHNDQPKKIAPTSGGENNEEQSEMKLADSEKCSFVSMSSGLEFKEISDCLAENKIIDHTEDQLYCPSESESSILLDALPQLSSLLETEDTDGVYNLKSLFSGKLFQQDEKKSVKKNRKKSPEKRRPNYFIAVQVSNPEVHCHIKKVQDHIVEFDKNLQLAVIPLTTLHLTLLVMHLENGEDLKRACDTLSSCYDHVKENINANPIHLEFHGLSHFQNQVLFAKVTKGKERLDYVAGAVAKCFCESGLTVTDKTDYKAHLTIMKLSRSPKLWKKGIKKIKPSCYTDFKNTNFGIQTVRGLQLLKMARADDESGYYVCSQECKFDLPIAESDDHTGCCQSPSLKTFQNSSKKANLRVATAEVKNEIKQNIHTLTTASLNKAGQCKDKTDEES